MARALTRWCWLVWLAGLLLSRPWPAAAATSDSGWFHQTWLSEDGLPNDIVSGLVQTPDGYLWLGFPNGLARFDGVRFQEFSLTNFVAGNAGGIHTMALGREGGLRLAMDRGAVVYLNAGTARVLPESKDLPEQAAQDIVEDGEGALWLAFRAGSVYRIKDTKETAFGPADGLPSGASACALARDDRGRVWFAKDGQFGTFRDGRFQTVASLDRADARLARAQDGGIWIWCGNRLLKCKEGGKPEQKGQFNDPGGDLEVNVMLEDYGGSVWIGTAFKGLYRFGRDGFERVGTSHPTILSLAEDHEGNLWVGTGGGGLNRVRPRAVELEGPETGLPIGGVQSLCEQSDGTVWAVTQNHLLARRTGGQWDELATNAMWPGDANCVAAGPSGRVWVGTRRHGLSCWEAGRFVPWQSSTGLRGQTIHTLVASRAGDLWIGEQTPNAVQCLHDGRLRTFDLPENFRSIRASVEDAYGYLWFGSSQGNLLRFSADGYSDQTAGTSGDPQSIRCLEATSDGSLWIGYAGWGLGRLKNGRFARIRSTQGLYSDFISQIVADAQGALWFGSDAGVFKARQKELDDVAEGRADRVQCIHYGRGEGLPGSQASSGDSPGALRDRDGRIWMPLSTTLAIIHPDRLLEEPRPPRVILSRVAVDDRTVAWYGGVLPVPRGGNRVVVDLQAQDALLRVPPDHHRLEFEFTAFRFLGPENVQFRYQLEGFDDGWIEAGTQRTVVYSRLPARKYRFQVNISNGASAWNENAASLNVVVLPFFWQRWWFRLLALALFTLSVVSIVRYLSFRRVRERLQEAEHQAAVYRERARIAKDIHDDLGANLTQIALLGELARQDRRTNGNDSADHVETISSTARQAIRSLDEIVWAVNPRNDTLAQLMDYTGQFAVDYLRLADIRCRLDLPEETIQREVSTEIRHNVFLVVKEALNNIVKHAGATEVWLRVAANEEGLKLTIEDNGRGFDMAAISAGQQGDGLRNLQNRAAEIGGSCRVESRPGSGTSVLLQVPWVRRRAKIK